MEYQFLADRKARFFLTTSKHMEALGGAVVRRLLLASLAVTPVFAPATFANTMSAPEKEHVQTLVENFLLERVQFPGVQAQVEVAPFTTGRIAHCDEPLITLPKGRSLSPKTVVSVRCLGQQAPAFMVRADVSALGRYWVAEHAIRPGEVITEEMLGEREGDLLRLAPDALTDLPQLIGKVAVHQISANRAVRRSSVRSANALKRGQSVRIHWRQTGVEISHQADVLADADVGARVTLRAKNGRMLQGWVQPDGTVLVDSL